MATPVFQIVGFQNSGKTTFVSEAIQYLSDRNIRVSVLKHHGHGGAPDLGVEKDSIRHYNAGAIAAVVEGEGVIQVIAHIDENNAAKKIALLEYFDPDIILIEGFKGYPYPKIVMIRREDDLGLLERVQNICAVVFWPEMEAHLKENNYDYVLYPLSDKPILYEWLYQQSGQNKTA